jgi:hypothetical protein
VGARSPVPARRASSSIGLILLLFVLTALGFYLRLWLIGHAPIDSDEATVGLMAHAILHGHFSAFYWGQSYGGAEPYAVAAVFALAGQSPFTLALVPALLSLIAVVVVWRIGCRLFGRRAGLVAAVLSWIWCESSLWNAIRENGFREIELVVGLLVLLQVLRIRGAAPGGKGDSVGNWFAIGALVGLGWWAAPEIVYFALPGAVFLLGSLWRRPRAGQGVRLGATAAGFVVFALPWIVASFSDKFATLRAPGGNLLDNSYADRLSTFFSHVLPMVFGLRVEGPGQWEVSAGFGAAVYVVLLLALVASLILIGHQVPRARPLVAVAALYPLLYCAFPSAWYWSDGRYAISLTPVVALVLVGGVWTLVSENVAQWTAVAVLVAATASTLVALNTDYGALASSQKFTAWRTNPNAVVVALGSALRAHGVSNVYAGYWVGYDLQFCSGDRIAVMPAQSDRDLAESAAVEVASRAGWVFVGSAPGDRAAAESQFGADGELNPGVPSGSALETWLVAHHVPYHSFHSGPMEVVVPSRNVTPGEVGQLRG